MREGSGSLGAQFPAGTQPHAPVPGSLPAAPSRARHSSAHSGAAASPSLIQPGPTVSQHVAAGGAQLEPPHTWMRTHLQPSPVMCFVNSFSLEGAEKAAVKHYHCMKQASSHPQDRRGAAPACRPLPAPHPSIQLCVPHGGIGWAGTEAEPGSADTLWHSRDKLPPPFASAPLQQNRSSNAAFPHTHSAQHLSASSHQSRLCPAVWGFLSTALSIPQWHEPPNRASTAGPCTPPGWRGSSCLRPPCSRKPVTQPHACWCICFNQDTGIWGPKVHTQQAPWIRGCASAFSSLNTLKPN